LYNLITYIGYIHKKIKVEQLSGMIVDKRMSVVTVGIKLLSDESIAPIFAHENDACADIRSNEDVLIEKGKINLVSTGIAMEIPVGYEAQIRPRSGLAFKHGIAIVNSPGTIDSGYRGEVKIIIVNLGNDDFLVKKGDRIAQMAIRSVPKVKFSIYSDLARSERGEGGFGSTGIE
jgi:dUTP pyrophosphatase